MTHLTEEERHGVADGSVEPTPHLEQCAECAADVDRIRRLMKHVKIAKAATDEVPAELWPAIRARIEEKKVLMLPVTPSEARGEGSPRRWKWGIAGVVAAGFLGFWILKNQKPIDPILAEAGDSAIVLVALVDSTQAYQEEAQQLLNRLELQRAMLRPEAKAALERDLEKIDVAIAELQDAIRDDPRNPALRRLLASSYRQKVDLLKRVGNATG
jgi:hypothetical protein